MQGLPRARGALVWGKGDKLKYGGDGSKLFLMGHSAGAHLVAAVATNEHFLEAARGSLRDLSGVIPVDTAVYNVPLQMKRAGRAQAEAFGTDPEQWMPVSPWHHVERGKGMRC